MGVPVAKTTPPPPLMRLDVSNFQIHIEGAFAGRLRQPGDARHLGDVKKIFEIVRLVHEEPVNAKFLKGQRVVFLFVGGQCFKFGFQRFLAFSSSFTMRRLSCRRVPV